MPGMAIPLNDFLSLAVRYEPGEIVILNNEKFVYMPSSSNTYYGFFLLSLDKNWNEPILV